MPSRCYRPVSPAHRNESAYKLTCPSCGAPPGFLCASLRSGIAERRAHRKRRPVVRECLPDLREWWRSMRKYEGPRPEARPADLVVP
jgi:hypothetical protein